MNFHEARLWEIKLKREDAILRIHLVFSKSNLNSNFDSSHALVIKKKSAVKEFQFSCSDFFLFPLQTKSHHDEKVCEPSRGFFKVGL
jgi:hypothetical protein